MSRKAVIALEITEIFLLAFPLLMTADAAGFGENDLFRLLGCVAAGGAMYALCAFTAGLSRKLRQTYFANMIYYGSIVLCTVGTLLCSAVFSSNSLYPMLMVPGALYFCCSGGRTGKGKEPLSVIWLGVYCVLAIPLYLIHGYFSGEGAWHNAFVVVTILIIILGANLINQMEITKLAFQRKDTVPLLPKNLRGFNCRLLNVLLAAILALFLLKDVFADWLGGLFSLAARAFVNLISGFSGSTAEAEEESMSLGLPDYSYAKQESPSLLYLLAAVAAILLIIAFRKQIGDFFRSIWTSIRAMLGKKSVTDSRSEAYTDYVYHVEKGGRRKNPYKAALREYRRERNPSRRYRAGYKAFLCRLLVSGKQPEPSDTVEKQLQNAPADSEQIGRTYSSLRYNNGEISDEDLAEMDRFLKKL